MHTRVTLAVAGGNVLGPVAQITSGNARRAANMAWRKMLRPAGPPFSESPVRGLRPRRAGG